MSDVRLQSAYRHRPGNTGSMKHVIQCLCFRRIRQTCTCCCTFNIVNVFGSKSSSGQHMGERISDGPGVYGPEAAAVPGMPNGSGCNDSMNEISMLNS